MKTVTNLVLQKNNSNRFNLYLDNSFAFGLQAEIIYKYNIEKGMKLSDDFIEDVLKFEEHNKAYNYSIGILTRKDKTKKEIINKLKQKGYNQNTIDNTIQKLEKYNYINDELYCKKYINDKINFSKKGKNRIKIELYQKGVDKNIISKRIDEIDNNIEYDRALSIATKKLKSYANQDVYKKKQKLFSHLVYKGFDYNLINKIINEIIR